MLILKDTRSAYWRNELVSPNTFLYTLPARSKRRVGACHESRRTDRAREAKTTPLKVHLFATPGSRDEYYGEWIVVHFAPEVRTGVAQLTLKRAAEQDQTLCEQYGMHAARPYRSKNENAHALLLAKLFPASEWLVVHEPETLLDLHEPSVKKGRATTGRVSDKLTRSYTCDFVVASRVGCARLCIESKPTRAHLTAEAVCKCRLLRDATCTRVVALVGSGAQDAEWCDMGAPHSVGEPVWYEMDKFLEAVVNRA